MRTIIVLGIVVLMLLAGCAQAPVQEEKTMMEEPAMEETVDGMTMEEMDAMAEKSMGQLDEMSMMPEYDWRDTEFKDVSTGETFKITDFKDKKVMIESFAVWCPICKSQQDKIKELHEELGDSVVSISLDTDPNEDEDAVKRHKELHGFDWRFAVSPPDTSKSLISEFGISVVNAPSAPIVLVCPGEEQNARLMGRGVKTASELKEELEKGC